MSVTSLITINVWAELTRAVKASKQKSIVAVAYFGQNAAKMLPLSKRSILLVDASISALKSGQTCPDELLKLYYKGVQIYSLENLHTKLFVIGNTLFCGSTNVSGNSANRLKETLLKTTDKKAIADAKEFINSFCRLELGNDEITRLNKFYKPPKFFGGPKNESNDNAEFHICKLYARDLSDEELAEFGKGRVIANQKRIKKSRHIIEEFVLAKKINFKIGDNILQIVKEGRSTYVIPIGKLIHIRNWSNGIKIKHYCFVEVPDKGEKPLAAVKKQLDPISKKAICRAGKKNLELESALKKILN